MVCTRCRRAQALPLYVSAERAATAARRGWHETGTGWVCGHCWTDLDRRRERELCRLCSRDARPGEDKRGGWRGPDEEGYFLCPECHIAGEESVRVQCAKDLVHRWHEKGGPPKNFECLVDDALRREREIVVALLRSKVAHEGARPTEDEWREMISRAVEAARAAWPEPIGRQARD